MVYERQSGITDALVAYNDVIGQRLARERNFFHFLKIILGEECKKSFEFADLIRKAGACDRVYHVCICVWNKQFYLVSSCILCVLFPNLNRKEDIKDANDLPDEIEIRIMEPLGDGCISSKCIDR